MALTLVGNSEIVAHIRDNLCYLICVRYLIRSKDVIFSENTYFPVCATWSELQSNISTMVRGYSEGGRGCLVKMHSAAIDSAFLSRGA